MGLGSESMTWRAIIMARKAKNAVIEKQYRANCTRCSVEGSRRHERANKISNEIASVRKNNPQGQRFSTTTGLAKYGGGLNEMSACIMSRNAIMQKPRS